jgi:AraC-like DNA-binding protein
MEVKLFFQSHHENLEEFQKKTVKSSRDTLIMVAEGEYSILPKGSREALTLRKNEIALIPKNIEFERSVGAPVTYYNISFYAQSDHPFYQAVTPGRIKLPATQIAAMLESMKYASLITDNRELITHMIEHVFTENYLFRSSDNVKSTPFSEEIQRAVRYMNKNLHKKISIEELAEQVFLSHSGLIWKFKQELNTSPSYYLHLLRMRKAEHLLLGSPCSIAEISELCGYQNPYYFTNTFHKHSGMSPTAFRKRYLKDGQEE